MPSEISKTNGTPLPEPLPASAEENQDLHKEGKARGKTVRELKEFHEKALLKFNDSHNEKHNLRKIPPPVAPKPKSIQQRKTKQQQPVSSMNKPATPQLDDGKASSLRPAKPPVKLKTDLLNHDYAQVDKSKKTPRTDRAVQGETVHREAKSNPGYAKAEAEEKHSNIHASADQWTIKKFEEPVLSSPVYDIPCSYSSFKPAPGRHSPNESQGIRHYENSVDDSPLYESIEDFRPATAYPKSDNETEYAYLSKADGNTVRDVAVSTLKQELQGFNWFLSEAHSELSKRYSSTRHHTRAVKQALTTIAQLQSKKQYVKVMELLEKSDSRPLSESEYNELTLLIQWVNKTLKPVLKAAGHKGYVPTGLHLPTCLNNNLTQQQAVKALLAEVTRMEQIEVPEYKKSLESMQHARGKTGKAAEKAMTTLSKITTSSRFGKLINLLDKASQNEKPLSAAQRKVLQKHITWFNNQLSPSLRLHHEGDHSAMISGLLQLPLALEGK